MTTLALALLLVGQPNAELDRVRDLEFRRVEAEWVASLVPPWEFDRAVDRALDWRDAELLRALDAPRYGTRRLAADLLARRGDDAWDVLCWGSLDPTHPAVSNTCRRLMRRLYLCRDCRGSGVCTVCKGAVRRRAFCPAKCDYARRCRSCDGTGNLLWRRVPYEDVPFVPRNLFNEEIVK